jgi:hypothetical protein
VITFTLGPLRRDDQVDADGARLLRQRGDRRLDLALHVIIRSAISSMTTTT